MEHHGFPDHTKVYAGPSDWLLVGLMVILTIGQIFLAILLFPKFRKHLREHTARTSNIVIISALTNFILPISSILSIATTVMVLIYSDFHHRLYLVDICSKLTLCLYLGCQTLMLIIFTLRIDSVFSHTPLAYPPHVVKLLRAVCFIFTLFYCFVSSSRIFELWYIFEIIAIIWIALYFCLSVLLCILFIRRVEALMVATVIDPDMIHIILKSSILIPISIGSSVVLFCTWLLIEYGFTRSEWHPAGIFWTVVDCTVSAVCLFLLFVSNDSQYRKSCHCIHHYFAKKETHRIEQKSSTGESTEKSNSEHTENKGGETNNCVIISSILPTTKKSVELLPMHSAAVKSKVNTETINIDVKLDEDTKKVKVISN